MKRTKMRLLSLALVLAMALSLLPTAAFAAGERAGNAFDGVPHLSGYSEGETAQALEEGGTFVIYGSHGSTSKNMHYTSSGLNWCSAPTPTGHTITNGNEQDSHGNGEHLYVFTPVNGKDNTYTIRSAATNATAAKLYLCAASTNGTTASLSLGAEANAAEFTVTPVANSNNYQIVWTYTPAGEGTPAPFYLVWTGSTWGLVNASTYGTANAYVMRLFKETYTTNPIASIPGYTRVTTADGLVEGSYLVIAIGDDGNYYVLRPHTWGSGSDTLDNMTYKLTLDENNVVTGVTGHESGLDLSHMRYLGKKDANGKWHFEHGTLHYGPTGQGHNLWHDGTSCSEMDSNDAVSVTYDAENGGTFKMYGGDSNVTLFLNTSYKFSASSTVGNYNSRPHKFLFFKLDSVDKSALTTAIRAAGELREADYTAATWTALETALTTANEVNSNAGATQEQVGNAVTALQTAMNALELVPLTIEGYEQVTEAPVDGMAEGYYLILAPCGNDVYVLYPGGKGGDAGNSRKLVMSPGRKGTGLIAVNGTGSTIELSKAHNRVVVSPNTAAAGTKRYHISAVAASDTTGGDPGAMYEFAIAQNHVLYHIQGGTVGTEDEVAITANEGGQGTLNFRGTGSGTLYFGLNANHIFSSSGTSSNVPYQDILMFRYTGVEKGFLRAKKNTIESSNLNESEYTAESWTALQNALTAAGTVLNKADATQTEVDNALDTLTTARNTLSRLTEGKNIPGYTLKTDTNFSATKRYLIVAWDSANHPYALYFDNGEVSAGALPTTNPATTTTNVTAITATNSGLTFSGGATEAGVQMSILPGGTNTYFVRNGDNYLSLADKMFRTAPTAINITKLTGVTDNSFQIKSASRYLALNVHGDNACSANNWKNYGTAFWGPSGADGVKFHNFIYESNANFDAAPMPTGATLVAQMLDNGDKNTWVFTGGRAVEGTFEDIGLARTAVSSFEEYVRWTGTSGSGDQGTQRQRYVYNAGYDGQTLDLIVSSFDERIKPLKPKAVAYAVGPEDLTKYGNDVDTFKTQLGQFIDKALAVRNTDSTTEDTFAVIVKPYKTAANGEAVNTINTAIDEVLEEKASVATKLQVVSSADFSNDTTHTYINEDGYPTAKGQLRLSYQFTHQVVGYNGNENAFPAARDYNGLYTVDWPGELVSGEAGEVTLDPAYDAARAALKTKVDDADTPMTWLFMGDSITHGAMWSEGQDTISQLFEKFVKSDLGRDQDIVLSTAVSSATTASTLAHINERISNYSPDVVSIMIGTNDAAGNPPNASIDTYKTNVVTILNAIFAKTGAIAVIRTPIPNAAPNRGERMYQYVAALKEVVNALPAEKKSRVIVVDQFPEWAPYLMTADNGTGTTFLFGKVFTEDSYKLHPGPVGHLWMTQEFIRDLGLWSTDSIICKLHYHQDASEWGITTEGNSAVYLEDIFAYNATTKMLSIPTASLNNGNTLLSATVTVTAGGRTYTGTALRGTENVTVDLTAASDVTDVTLAATSLVSVNATSGKKVNFVSVDHLDLTAQREADATTQAGDWTHLSGSTGGTVAAGSNGGVVFTGAGSGFSGSTDVFVNEALDAAIAGAEGEDKYVSFTASVGTAAQPFGFALRVKNNTTGFYIGYDNYSKWYTQRYDGTGNYRSFDSTAIAANTPYNIRIQWNETTGVVRVWINGVEKTVGVNTIGNITTENSHAFTVRGGTATVTLTNLHYSGDNALDTYVIDNAIRRAKTLDENAYGPNSWAAMQTALTAAIEARASKDQAQINEKGEALATALANLRIKAVIPEVTPVPDGATVYDGGDEALLPPNHDQVTNGQPFNEGPYVSTGVAGSVKFRIPALLSLKHQQDPSKNGRMVAAMDARWGHGSDAYGLDTMVAVSSDNGETWSHQYVNYFADSEYGGQPHRAAVFIDPVLAEGTDGTIYMMTDIFPGGVATLGAYGVTPATDNGYRMIDGKKRMILYTMTDGTYNANNHTTDRRQTNDNWTFYIGDFEGDGVDKYATIFTNDGEPTRFYVDEYYYLYQTATDDAAKDPANDKIYCQQIASLSASNRNNFSAQNENVANTYVQQNVFFYNSVLHVRCASYLWVVTSTDGGETWSKPSILNPQVRYDPAVDQFYGVGPGAGLTLEKGPLAGMVLLPTYIHGGPTGEIAEFIYTRDGGKTWGRSQRATEGGDEWSSESFLVQIGDYTVRHFYRDGDADDPNVLHFTDHTWDVENEEWIAGDQQTVRNASGGTVFKTNGNQLSGLMYSKRIDGKEAIILSTAATSARTRQHGTLYVMLLEDDEARTMTQVYSYEVNGVNDLYSYSSVAETPDGSIADLYETGNYGARTTFGIIPIGDIVSGAVISETETTATQYFTVPLYGSATYPVSSAAMTALRAALSKDTVVQCSTMGDSVVLTGLDLTETPKTVTYEQDGVTVTAVIQVEGTPNQRDVNLTLPDGNTHSDTLPKGSTLTYNSAPEVVSAQVIDVTESVNISGAAKGKRHASNGYTGESVVDLVDCLYTVTAAETAGQYYIQSVRYPEYYMNISGAAKRPNGAKEAITVANKDASQGTVTLRAGGGSYLCFYQLHFDRQSSDGATCAFYLYRPVRAGEASSTEIPGFVKVNGAGGIESGKQYLVVPKVDSNYYALYPSVEAEDFASSIMVDPATTGNQSLSWVTGSQITLTGTYNGTAVVVAGSKRYDVTVTGGVEPPVPVIAILSPTEMQTVSLPRGDQLSLSVFASVTGDATLHYQWFKDSVAIDGATSATYTVAQVTAADAGAYTCQVSSEGAETKTVLFKVVVEERDISSDATLSALTIAGAPLNETFAPETLVYTANVKNDVTTAHVTATTTHSHATVEFSMGIVKVQDGLFDLEVGQNYITVKVTAEDGITTKTYTLVITRADSTQDTPTPPTPPSGGGASRPVGGGPSGPSVPVGPQPGTETTEKGEDGSTTTTYTDSATGTVTEVTVRPDGTVETAKTEANGTVTETVAQPDGVVVQTVVTPEKEDAAVSVTLPQNAGETAVNVPLDIDYTSVAVDADGNIIPLSVPTDQLDAMQLKLAQSSELTIVKRPHAFEDVEDHWATDAINFSASHELFKGTSETTFTPEGDMTRGMLVTVLARFDGEDTQGEGVWYEKGLDWAVAKGVSDGTGMEDVITREQLVTMLYRYAKERGADVTTSETADLSAFADNAATSDWAKEAMTWAVETGILKGLGDGTLAPQQSASRAQVSTVMLRFCQVLVK